MSKKKPAVVMRFIWIPATVCKAVADLFVVLLVYYHYIRKVTLQSPPWFDYFWVVPFIIVAVIIFSVWASSSWRRTILISIVFSTNTLLCFLAGNFIGFWNNPWLVVAGWLWILSVVVCLVVRLIRSFFSPRHQNDTDESIERAGDF